MTIYRWIIIHWFEISALLLLCLNLWYLLRVRNTLDETNRWFSILASYLAEKQRDKQKNSENRDSI
jgi:hypothetical protein